MVVAMVVVVVVVVAAAFADVGKMQHPFGSSLCGKCSALSSS